MKYNYEVHSRISRELSEKGYMITKHVSTGTDDTVLTFRCLRCHSICRCTYAVFRNGIPCNRCNTAAAEYTQSELYKAVLDACLVNNIMLSEDVVFEGHFDIIVHTLMPNAMILLVPLRDLLYGVVSKSAKSHRAIRLGLKYKHSQKDTNYDTRSLQSIRK